VSGLTGNPPLLEAVISLAILGGSYLVARLASSLLARLVTRRAARGEPGLHSRLVVALRGPITFALFLIGAWVAVHRLPLTGRGTAALDGTLFVAGVFVFAMALVRLFGILLAWYAAHPRLAHESHPAVEFGPLLGKLGTVFIGLVAVITLLQHFGIDVASLVVSLGVGSLAVGLAAQDTLANMFAGFTLMLDRPFRIGDRVQLASGEVGDVEEIGMRATRIRTVDDVTLVVPNALLVKERLLNLSHPSRRLVTKVEVGVAFGAATARVRRLLEESVRAAEGVDHGSPCRVLLSRFGGLGLYYSVVFRVRDYAEQAEARSEVLEQIHRRLGEAGIAIPTRAAVSAVGGDGMRVGTGGGRQ
jgi:small-conductance mechanosensitive channel